MNNTAVRRPLESPPVHRPRIALRVTTAAERALRKGHPWLFERAIAQQSREGSAGDLAIIYDRKNRFLAVGLYDPYSRIRVRVLQHGTPAVVGQAWFAGRLRDALAVRSSLDASATTGYRLVHGESEGFPGLVIDRYAQTCVIKLYSAAWLPHLPELVSALEEVVAVPRVVLRLSRAVRQVGAELGGLEDGASLLGPELAEPVLFQENGLWFEADVVHGQKTGFFLDQRENRSRVERLSRGQRVLDGFAYSGGFSLYAARGGARSVVSLDASRPALDAALRNFARNQGVPTVAAAQHTTIVGDVFEALATMSRRGRRFDVVVLDPPAFAKKESEAADALRAYERLAQAGLGVLRGGGTLVMASCSTRVSADDFFACVHRAAGSSGRSLREIERTGHPIDHPICFREGAYLKCLFAVAK